MTHEILKIGERITVLPVIHGSGDFALAVRRVMLEHDFDCLAVPLPESFRAHVEAAIESLPIPTVVTQAEPATYQTEWSPEADADEEEEDVDLDDRPAHSYVPIDPCQPVIAALRVALGEHIGRAYIDLETACFRPVQALLPDPYALKRVALERFAAALLPALGRLPEGQPQDRCLHMASRLMGLEQSHQSVLLVCSLLDWPWIRDAYGDLRRGDRTALDNLPEHDLVEETAVYQPETNTLLFLLGELPFVTGLYERARAHLEDDQNLSIDGIKELLIAARESYKQEFKGRARKITPHALKLTLKYLRNLSLISRRMTPALYDLVIGSKQVLGDMYAMHVAETAREYPYDGPTSYKPMAMGIDQARLTYGEVVRMVSRLPGPPLKWGTCCLKRRPLRPERQRWRMQWNPFSQCSWPPEDELIENFRSHVFARAMQIMGADLVKTEKFTTSVKDGIDIRDTLRNWHTGDIYVKVLPPGHGSLDCAVMLFDSPADPRDYPWRTTWYAEHENESTLAFYATNYTDELVGPGIALATYGGALFLFPPVAIPDIWGDEQFDFCETLEERILAAACVYSESQHVALLSPLPPGAGWRRLAKRYGKRLVHVPLGQFSQSTVQQLRMVHVLNGHHVRSYASEFIRQA